MLDDWESAGIGRDASGASGTGRDNLGAQQPTTVRGGGSRVWRDAAMAITVSDKSQKGENNARMQRKLNEMQACRNELMSAFGVGGICSH